MIKLSLQEYIREKKLCEIIEIECTNDFVIKIDAFFTELFSGLKTCTRDGKPDLIFMKGDKYIMHQDLKHGWLRCRYDGFWNVLKESFSLEYSEIQLFISYKVEEAYKTSSLTPRIRYISQTSQVEETYKTSSLTPLDEGLNYIKSVEKAYKMGSLTPKNNNCK